MKSKRGRLKSQYSGVVILTLHYFMGNHTDESRYPNDRNVGPGFRLSPEWNNTVTNVI